jgi:hypothetical protein
MHVYEIRPRKDKRGVDLISDALPFGRLWYGEPNAVGNTRSRLRFGAKRETKPGASAVPCAKADSSTSYGRQASVRSESNPKQPYVGLTRDLRQRTQDHNERRSPRTKKFRTWILVACFAFAQEKMAVAFEKYLKSASG